VDLFTVVDFLSMPPKEPPAWADFQMIREPCPEIIPLTPEAQKFYGEYLGVHETRHHLIRKRAMLCLPENAHCARYIRWFEQQPNRPRGVGSMIVTSSDWIHSFGYPAYTELLASLRRHGRPSVHWQFIAFVDPEGDR
jgi:hypothetical protein